MAEQHQEKGGLIQSPALVIVAVVASIVIPVAGYFIAQLATGGRPAKDSSEEAVARRILPVAKVELAAAAAPGAPAAAPAAASAATPAAAAAPAPTPAAPAAAPTGAPASAGAGKKVYDATCVVCHGAGIAGAPKLGDKAAWAPRLKTGMDALVNSALKGKNAMPPKGGNASIPDADIRAAVEYMAAAAK